MKFKSKKAIAANSLVALFSIVAIFALAFDFFRYGGITGFDLMSEKSIANDFMGWNLREHIIVGFVLACVMFALAATNYFVKIRLFDKIKINPFSIIMTAIGAVMIVMAVKIFIESEPIRDKSLIVSGSMGIGWILLILASSWATAAAIGTQFFNK